MMSIKEKGPTPQAEVPTPSAKTGDSIAAKDPDVMTLTTLINTEAAAIQWLARPWLAPGRPTLLFGAKDTAKSLIAVDLMLATAWGRPWLGCMPLQRRGRAVLLDYEPKVHPRVRVQQLLDFNPLGAISPMGERDLEAHCPPAMNLANPQAEHWLTRICADTTLLVVDALAAATPGKDECAVEYRRTLDMLTAVSQRTGACMLVVHHEGLGGGRPRGHTGISQASGCEIRVTKAGPTITLTPTSAGPGGEKPQPVTVELTASQTNPVTGLADRIRLHPPRPKPCGTVVELRPRDPTEKPIAKGKPTKSSPATDAELVTRAREIFGPDASTVGLRKLRHELGIGTTRARKLKGLL